MPTAISTEMAEPDKPVVFRPARSRDLAAIVSLLANDELGRHRENPELPLASDYLDAFAAVEADPNQLLVVVLDGDEVIGTLQISFIPGIARKAAWRGQIEAVRIAESQRNSGLGQQMFDWAISQCRSRGRPQSMIDSGLKLMSVS